jgi:hypothetical protein
MKKTNMYFIVMAVAGISAVIIALILLFVFNAEAGRRTKTKIRYKCFNAAGERVVCPENFKQSPGFKQHLRQKKAKLHDTRRHYYKDKTRPRPSNERTYMKSYPRTYYDETIREEAND